MERDDSSIVHLPQLDQRFRGAVRDLGSIVRGEVRSTTLDRGLYAADASPYEVMPIAVVSPLDGDDLRLTVAWCGERGIPIIPRGAGTSLAGQVVGEAVIVDCSPHMNRILEVDPERSLARVEPGVVLDDLRRRITSDGLAFGPDVSTSTHATIGGMIGNSSAGASSLVHGMTDQHVLGIDGVLADGDRVDFTTVDPSIHGSSRPLELARRLAEIVRPIESEIDARFPRVSRNVGGYRLDDVSDRLLRGDGRVDLGRFLAGTEGTLAVTAAATLRLVPRPRERVLLVIAFSNVADACGQVSGLVETGPSAVELMDAHIIDAAAAQAVFEADVRTLPGIDGSRAGAVLLVEYQGDDRNRLVETARRAIEAAAIDAARTSIVEDSELQARTWAIRTTGLGLISKPDGDHLPMPGLEDCGVPLDRLSSFQADFDHLIGSHGWTGVFYAHASVGLLHVRPRIDLSSSSDRDAFLRLRDQTLDLVLSYGGSISGAHGDGRIRGDLVARMYGPRIVEAFKEVKHAFDPAGVLNPGNKTGERDPLDDLRFDHERAGEQDGPFHFQWPEGGPLAMARACNGNGLCRRHDGGAMCPSYRAMLDERHSTRGRANALRLAIGGRLATDADDGIWGRADVDDVLSKCLSCKACRHECPSNVDLSKLKAEYQARARGGRRPNFRERILGRAGLHLRRASRARRLARAAASVPGSTLLAARLLDLDPCREIPTVAPHAAQAPTRRHAAADAPVVAILEDCFTSSLEPGILEDAAVVLDAFGWRVERLALVGCCGRPQVSSGLLEEARALVEASAESLRDDLRRCEAEALVVLEPSCLSALKEEWRELVTSVHQEVTETIASRSTSLEGFLDHEWERHPRRPSARVPDGVVVHPHCHAKTARGSTSSLLRRLGASDAEVLDSGCCGLAGSFGYRRENIELSREIFHQSLGERLDRERPEVLVAEGTSCRHQCRDLANVEATHPARLLARALASDS